MGFSWTPITQLITEIAAAHQNEIKANVDIVYSDLDLSQYGWEYLPVNVDDEVQHEHFQEMRDAIDYADDMNYCRSHDTGYNADDDAIARATVYSGEKTGVDGTYRATVHSSEKTGYDSSYDSGVDNDYKSTVHSDEKSGYDSGYHAGVDGAYDNGVLSGENEYYDSTDYYGADSPYQSSVQSDYYSTVDNLDNLSDHSSYDTGYLDSHDDPVYTGA